MLLVVNLKVNLLYSVLCHGHDYARTGHNAENIVAVKVCVTENELSCELKFKNTLKGWRALLISSSTSARYRGEVREVKLRVRHVKRNSTAELMGEAEVAANISDFAKVNRITK